MNRAEFMEKLKNLLSDIPAGEREEALNYYEDYFDDAGVENEAQVIQALGSPEKVARIIRDGISEGADAFGEFSENGYSAFEEEEKDVVVRYGAEKGEGFAGKIRKKGNGGLVLLLILAIFALPILGPLVIGIGSAVLGVLAAIAAILFSLVIVGIVMIVLGALSFVGAIGGLFVTPAMSAMLFGLSLLLLGIGILITVLGIWVATKTVPPVIKGIVNGIRKIFVKKEE